VGFDVKATTTSRAPMLLNGLLVLNLGILIDADLVMRSHSHPCRCSMLRCPASSVAHQLDAIIFDIEDSGRRISPNITGLREKYADWSARILGETSAVGAQCFGSSDLRPLAIRPCL